MAEDLDFRLLRYFVVVAEELHFSRAARRLFVAQQALSRDIRRLEERAGVPLLQRTTRRVTLTPAGELMLDRARRLLALHDETLRELRGGSSSVIVDIVDEHLTPALVLAAARERAPDVEFYAEFHGGLDQTVPLLLDRRVDVAFGRWGPLAGEVPAGLGRRLIRFERMAVLLPSGHRLAKRRAVPLAELRTAQPCWLAGSHATGPEWEHAARQLLTGPDGPPTPTHPHVRGTEELAHHLHVRNTPVLAIATHPGARGAVLRPVTNPTALYPWSMVWHTDLPDPVVRTLHDAVDALQAAHGWLNVPKHAWLPEPEASQERPAAGPPRA